MVDRVVLRRHITTLLPDVLLFFSSLLFMLEMRIIPPDMAGALKNICGGAAIFLMMIGFLDIVKWVGFRVVVMHDCIQVQRFWIFRDDYCQDQRTLTVRLQQNGWHEWINMGTLVIYELGGEVRTLDNLGNFKRVQKMNLRF